MSEEINKNEVSPVVKEKIESMKKSVEFANAVADASQSRIKIMTDLSKSMKECKKEYIKHMIDAYEKDTNTSFKKLEKDEKLTLNKEWNDTFTQLRKFNHGVMSADQKEEFHVKLAKQFSTIVKWWNYLGDGRLTTELANYGITISDSKPLASTNPTLGNESVKTSMNGIFKDVDSLQGSICKEADNIKINIFEASVPADLRFDKKTNPVGMKKGDFNNIVTIAATKSINEEKANKRATKIAENLIFEAASKTLVSEGVAHEIEK